MVKARKEHPWYNFDKIFSYNALISCICGGRGIGKTYGAIKFGIEQWMKNGDQFMYVRRYRPETSSARATFFDAVALEFPDWDFRVHEDKGQIAHVSTREDKKRDWSTINWFVTLSQGQSKKSSAYHYVTTMMFDEFIGEPGVQYLTNEAQMFVNLINTVDRYQDKTRVLMLSNAVSIMNPYFIEWDIDPQQANSAGIVKSMNGQVVAHFPDSADFKKSIYNTRFGKFIQGTEYAKYAVENEFADNAPTLVEQKDPSAVYVFTLVTSSGPFSVWYNAIEGEMYAQRKLPKVQRKYTMDPAKVSRDCLLLNYSDNKASIMRSAFKQGKLTFDHPRTRNSFMEVFKR